jgi:hypothetical protein
LDQAQTYYRLAIEALEYPEQQADGTVTNSSPSKSHYTPFLAGSSSLPRDSRSTSSLKDLTVIDEENKTPRFSTPSRKPLRHAVFATSPPSPSLYSTDGNDTDQPWSPEVKIGTPRRPLSKRAYLSLTPTKSRTTAPAIATRIPEPPTTALNTSVGSQHSAAARTRVGNFNAALDGFADMINEHAASASRFKQKVLKKQADEHAPAPFSASRHASAGRDGGDRGGQWAAGASPPGGSRMGWEEMVVRIDRLRARDWDMPRFDAEHYRGLCERAMEDLGGL